MRSPPRPRRAGFDAPVPAEVVRAHFAAVLAEADTRAPLLTGGVSFARMVPMRLLPFRVICLLGMNDGDFPRRDPAAGLNRLTAELGTDQRRHGDRSTRDDDRYLFLQLFSAAQDVFYVSWLGADPRDGSAREPSALVSELLAAAARTTPMPDDAAQELVAAASAAAVLAGRIRQRATTAPFQLSRTLASRGRTLVGRAHDAGAVDGCGRCAGAADPKSKPNCRWTRCAAS